MFPILTVKSQKSWSVTRWKYTWEACFQFEVGLRNEWLRGNKYVIYPIPLRKMYYSPSNVFLVIQCPSKSWAWGSWGERYSSKWPIWPIFLGNTCISWTFCSRSFCTVITVSLSSASDITKTRLYNVDPLKPHFYIVKLGFTGVYIIFLILLINIDCGYSLEPPRRGGSNEYPQSMFWAEIWKNTRVFYLKKISFWRWNFLYI